MKKLLLAFHILEQHKDAETFYRIFSESPNFQKLLADREKFEYFFKFYVQLEKEDKKLFDNYIKSEVNEDNENEYRYFYNNNRTKPSFITDNPIVSEFYIKHADVVLLPVTSYEFVQNIVIDKSQALDLLYKCIEFNDPFYVEYTEKNCKSVIKFSLESNK